jgi:hypothetical protein
MKCPNCQTEMEEGCITLTTSEWAHLRWSKEKLPSFWEFLKGKRVKNENLLKTGIPAEGFRCLNCRLVVFRY